METARCDVELYSAEEYRKAAAEGEPDLRVPLYAGELYLEKVFPLLVKGDRYALVTDHEYPARAGTMLSIMVIAGWATVEGYSCDELHAAAMFRHFPNEFTVTGNVDEITAVTFALALSRVAGPWRTNDRDTRTARTELATKHLSPSSFRWNLGGCAANHPPIPIAQGTSLVEVAGAGKLLNRAILSLMARK